MRLRFRAITDGFIRFLGQPAADAVANGTPRAPTPSRDTSTRFGGFFGR
jgi:hypothetical protein